MRSCQHLLRFCVIPLLTLLSAGLALAEVTPQAGMLTALDKNGDGLVSQQEFLSHRLSRFREADRDNDGQLSVRELRPTREKARTGELPSRFGRADTNGDGVLEASELPRMPRSAFEQRDGNGDGVLSLQELRISFGPARLPGPLRRVDTDASGTLSQSEVETAAARRFCSLDRDASGQLSAAELAARRRGKPAT